MNKRTRRATFLSVLVLVVGVVVGVGFAAAQTDEDVEPSTADAAPTQTTPAETAPSEAPSEPAAPPSVAPGSSEQSDSAHHKGRCGARLDTASEYLGIERQELRDRLASGESLASIADATEGKTAAGLREALLTDLTRQVEETDGLTEAQKLELTDRLEGHVDRLIAREGFRKRGHRGHGRHRGGEGHGGHGRHGARGHHGARGIDLNLRQSASEYLEVEPEAMLEQLRDDKSLAQIAEETPGKSVDGLEQAMTEAAKVAIEASENLSSEQKQVLQERVAERIAAVIEGDPRFGRGFGNRGGKGSHPPRTQTPSGSGGDAELMPSELNSGAAAILL